MPVLNTSTILVGQFRGSAYGALTNGNANFGTTACLDPAAFVNTCGPNFTGYTKFPTQTRNQFRGPNYVDFDMSLFKTFQLKEKLNLGIGATAFNVFDQPSQFRFAGL